MKLNNLSRLTALLLALMILMTSVVWADPVAEGDYTAGDYAEQLAAQTGTCAICVNEMTNGDFPTTDHNGNTITITCGYTYLESLGSAMERYNFLYYVYETLLDSTGFAAMYTTHEQHVEDGATPLLCTCEDRANTDLRVPGPENHAEDCPWVDGTTVIIPPRPDQPPLYNGEPNGNQYTSNETYSLPMINDRAVILPEGGRALIQSNQASGAQWQVYDGAQWVDIQGETAADIYVTDAKLNSIFELTGIAQLRYFNKDSNIVLASVSVTSQKIAGGEYGDTVEEAQLFAVERADETDDGVYTYTILYKIDIEQTEFDSWQAEWSPEGAAVSQMVTFPTVMGYAAYFDNEEEPSTYRQVDITSMTADEIHYVTYRPALVNYTVNHYVQNTMNDEYTLMDSLTQQGLTRSQVQVTPGAEMVTNEDGTNTYVVHDEDYRGLYALLFERPAIAADGSTVVEIYYDRIYYLMKFVLGEGGYGVEPIYDRFGATLDVGTPIRPGYEFKGWTTDPDNTDFKAADYDASKTVGDITTMPNHDVTYYAVWELADTVTVTIVHWGENADDEGYSYMDSTTVQVEPYDEYGYNNLQLECTLPEHQHSDELFCYGCGDVAHKHTAACYRLKCTIPEHAEHTAECYGNCEYADHVHTVGCYRVNHGTLSTTAENNTQRINTLNSTTPSNGVYRIGGRDDRRFYIKVGDYYYRITGNNLNDYYGDGELTVSTTCAASNHTHNDDCLSCTLAIHTHSGREAENGCYERICGLNEHDHTDDCVVCTTAEHSHTADCFDGTIPTHPDRDPETNERLWTFVKTEVKEVKPDGSTVINVYWDRVEFTFTYEDDNRTIHSFDAKWGSDISEKWSFVGTNGRSYPRTDVTTSWIPTNSDTYNVRITQMMIMPAEDIHFEHTTSDNNERWFYYYVESLPNTGGDKVYNGKNYDEYHSFEHDFNQTYYNDDFFLLIGFDRNVVTDGDDVIIDDAEPDENWGSKSRTHFFYTRHKYTLEFNSPITLLKTVQNIPYQMPLADHYYEPEVTDAPDFYEPGSVEFGGWYLNPECTGLPFDFENGTMPAGINDGDTTLKLYAKWNKVQHTVTFHLTKEAMEADPNNENLYVNQVFNVQHDDYLFNHMSTEQQIAVRNDGMIGQNGSRTFVGWFYTDANGQEHAFVPADMMVKRDMRLYAKWSSNILVEYEVRYIYKDGDNKIDVAAPSTGSALAEMTKTFPAKAGFDLYADYQDEYFPVVKSHSITMREDTTQNYYEFEYVKREAVPYVVYYVTETAPTDEDLLNLGTVTIDNTQYYLVAETKVVTDNTKAVRSEKFVPVTGYMPDAYQKSLVLTGETLTTDNKITVGNVEIHEDNVIVFKYTINDKEAYYLVAHYVETLNGGWDVYYDYDKVGDIGTTYEENKLNISGFTYNVEKTKELAPDLTVTDTKVSGELKEDGLELKLYYTRNTYPYQVRYLEKGSLKQLATPKDSSGKYGEIVVEQAISIDGYELVSDQSQSITIRIETSSTPQLNIITFLYEEKPVNLKYKVVGPAGVALTEVGTVAINDEDETTHPAVEVSETVDIFTGKAQGATAEPGSNLYRFVGWFDNENCAGNPISTSVSYVPTKADDTAKWVDGTTYYAKFEYNLTSLTIKKSGVNVTLDPNTSFVFNVSGDGINLDVVIHGNGTVTIDGLTVAETYTITEKSGSWRYVPDASTKTKTLGPDSSSNVVEFVNKRKYEQWLDSEMSNENVFEDVQTTN